MKEILGPPAIVENRTAAIRELFAKNVAPTYARFDLALSHGAGSYVWDVSGRRYLDLGAGIAVCALGHAHPEVAETLAAQARRLVHVSNLYYHEPQGRLAAEINRRLGPGKIFFCNSGAEANEGLYKLARKFGHDEGRFEILSAWQSFHGRTLGGISATGQEKVKKGFEPMVAGFRHVPYNDLDAIREAISPATAAVLIEGIQGEGGITPARVDYLLGLRRLCDERRLLLLMDGVQCGHYRSGAFQSFQRILEDAPAGKTFLPDGLSMAKSLGGGYPMGAFWVRDEAHGGELGALLGPGTHGTTFGGTPMACSVALKILEVIDRERLAGNVRSVGTQLEAGLVALAGKHPGVVRSVRGLGFMLGLELRHREQIPGMAGDDRAASAQFTHRLHELGVLTVPSGTQVIRLLPPLNLSQTQADEGLAIIGKVIESFAA